MKLYILVITVLLLFSNNCYTQNANPTRPSASDNAYLTQLGFSEIEIGYLRAPSKVYSVPALLKFTFLNQFELGLLTSGIIVSDGLNSKFGEPGIQLKYQLFNSENLIISTVGKVEFLKHASPKYTTYLVPTIQTQLAQLDMTLGTSFIKIGKESNNSFIYAVALSPKFDLPIGFYAEIFGESLSGTNISSFDFGISCPVYSDFIIDCAYAIGLNENTANWTFQFGFTKTLFKFL